MTTERWKPVVGFEDRYEVSSLGRVRSIDVTIDQMGPHGKIFRRFYPGKLLKLQVDRSGYLRACLYRKAKLNFRPVHQLVLEAFIGPCPSGKEGAHNNGVKSNNSVGNLAWKTTKENGADKAVHGSHKGVRNAKAKLTEEDVKEIRRLFKPRSREFGTVALGRKFGVSDATIGLIVRGNNWRHL